MECERQNEPRRGYIKILLSHARDHYSEALKLTGDGIEVRGKEPIMSLVRRHPLISFFVLAYALSWWLWPLYAAQVSPFSPDFPFLATGVLLAALIVISITTGRAGLRELGARMIRWRVNGRWYAAALSIPLAVAVVAIALNVALGAPVPSLAKLPPVTTFLLVFAVGLINPLNGPMAEEPGWRGFALPRLLAGRSPLVATALLALLVAVWHLPLVAAGLFPPILLLGAFGVQFWYAWLFNRTGGSVLITLLMHAAEGTFAQLVVARPFEGADLIRVFWLYVIATCVAAICLVVFDRKAWRGPAAAGPPV
jgi:membrane protease YdiL (CAAX protease family)